MTATHTCLTWRQRGGWTCWEQAVEPLSPHPEGRRMLCRCPLPHLPPLILVLLVVGAESAARTRRQILPLPPKNKKHWVCCALEVFRKWRTVAKCRTGFCVEICCFDYSITSSFICKTDHKIPKQNHLDLFFNFLILNLISKPEISFH